jgi:homocysteine S-methyltransferase
MQEAGVDAINFRRGLVLFPNQSPCYRMENTRDSRIETVLHLTCRDRNIIGMQSDLLGCAAAGIKNLLIITGDPPKLGDYPQATAVFDIDSIGLTRIAARLNSGIDIGGKEVDPATEFLIGVGADPTHLDQEREIERLFKKAEAGAYFCITQPVYDVEALLRFLEKIRDLSLKVIAGVWPLASLQNALPQ